MNDERRMKLKRAASLLGDAQNLIEEVKGDEEETYENMPEGLQSGEKGEKMQAAVEALGEAYDSIDQASEQLSQAME